MNIFKLLNWSRKNPSQGAPVPDLSSVNIKALSQCENLEALINERERLNKIELDDFGCSYGHSGLTTRFASDKQEASRKRLKARISKHHMSRSEWDQRLKTVNKKIADLEYSPDMFERSLQFTKKHIKGIATGFVSLTLGMIVFKSSEEILFEGWVSDEVRNAARLLELDGPDYAREEVILYGFPAQEGKISPYGVLGRLTHHSLSSNYKVLAKGSGGSALFLHQLDEAAPKGQIALAFSQQDVFLQGLKNGEFENVREVTQTGISDCAQIAVHPTIIGAIEKEGGLKPYMQTRALDGDPLRIITTNHKFGSPYSLEILFGDVFEDFDVEVIAKAQSQDESMKDFLESSEEPSNSGGYDLAFYMESPAPVFDPGKLGINNPLPNNLLGSAGGLFHLSGQLGFASDINKHELGIVSFSEENYKRLSRATGLPYSFQRAVYDVGVTTLHYEAENEEGGKESELNSVNLICTQTGVYITDPESLEETSRQLEARALLSDALAIPFKESLSSLKDDQNQGATNSKTSLPPAPGM